MLLRLQLLFLFTQTAFPLELFLLVDALAVSKLHHQETKINKDSHINDHHFIIRLLTNMLINFCHILFFTFYIVKLCSVDFTLNKY